MTDTAERDAGIAQAAEPCWFPADSTGQAFEYGEGSPHWRTIEEATESLASILKQYDEDEAARPTVTLHRESEPCWHLTCEECGYRYDEDEWVSHFFSKADAEAAADDCDWHIVDGRLLCPECVTPPGEGRA